VSLDEIAQEIEDGGEWLYFTEWGTLDREFIMDRFDLNLFQYEDLTKILRRLNDEKV